MLGHWSLFSLARQGARRPLWDVLNNLFRGYTQARAVQEPVVGAMANHYKATPASIDYEILHACFLVWMLPVPATGLGPK